MTWSVSISHKTRIPEEQHEYLSMACWQTELPRRGKSRLEGRSDRSLLSQRLEHQEGVGQHDQGQVAMRAVPTASLKVIQAAFALRNRFESHPDRLEPAARVIRRSMSRLIPA